MRVRVHHGGGAVGRPAGVADAGFAGEWVVNQQIGEVHQLADGAAAIKPAVLHGGDPGAVVATVFEALQRFDQNRGGFVIAKDADNTAHGDYPLF